MSMQQVLLEALQDLSDEEFKTFKWYLSQRLRDDCKPLARSHMESSQRTDIVTRLYSNYGPGTAVDLTVLILKKMNKNYTASEFRKAWAVINPSGAVSAVDSAPGAPADLGAPAGPASAINVLADNGSVALAPIISGGTPGTWNINISR